MNSPRLIVRHALTSVIFILLYLLLNRPEVVFFSRIGLVAWYPAVGLAMALMLGLSPWYALPTSLSVSIANCLIYHQSFLSFSSTIDALAIGVCYGGGVLSPRTRED